MPDLTYRGSADDLRAIFRDLPRMLAGTSADVGGVARGLQLRIGVALLSQIQQDFVTKARGGTGRDGVKWKALSPATIAQRPITKGERKKAGIKGKRVRGLLTPAQDKRWRKIFASRKTRLMARGMGAGEASARAAAIAWSILKAEGAQTKLAVFGGRSVEILRDSGRLFRSLTPGVEDKPSGEPEQVFETPAGEVTVGTNVPYAGRQFRTRPAWPTDGSIPDAWWPAILKATQRGLTRIVALMVAG